jgi:hypothetical protein
VIGMTCRYEGETERRRIGMSHPAEAEEVAERMSLARRDKESACAPKHGKGRGYR